MEGESLTVGFGQNGVRRRAPEQGSCPWGQAVAQNHQAMPRFLIQEHHARTHYFDFRLEKTGEFKSCAAPKGVPEHPGVERLAVQVEDHDLTFGDFEGTLPRGQYDAREVRTLDRGIDQSEVWSENEIIFVLQGQSLQCAVRLVRFKRGCPCEWLLFRRSS